jgi:hypothetical protein
MGSCFYAVIETAPISHVGISLEVEEKWGCRLANMIEMTGILLLFANAIIFGKNEIVLMSMLSMTIGSWPQEIVHHGQ